MVKSFKNNCLEGKRTIECEKYFGRDLKKAEKLASEFALRTKVLLDKIEEMKGDKKKLRNYLNEEGYSEKEIKTAIADKDIFEKIKNRYNQEREYLILRMSEELRKMTLAGKKKQLIKFDNNETFDKIKAIKQKLASRVEEYKQLIHFKYLFLMRCCDREVPRRHALCAILYEHAHFIIYDIRCIALCWVKFDRLLSLVVDDPAQRHSMIKLKVIAHCCIVSGFSKT